MFSGELKQLFIQVITSWQVIAVTVILVVYVFLVNYVSRTYHRHSRRPPLPKVKDSPARETLPEGGDELGLEETKEN